MKSKHNTSATTIINIVAKDPSSTASTLYQYFQEYCLGDPSEEEIQLFEKKKKKF